MRDATFCADPAFTTWISGCRDSSHLTERVNLEFRAEAFNLFNTPQFGLPNATLGQVTTGTYLYSCEPATRIAVCFAACVLMHR